MSESEDESEDEDGTAYHHAQLAALSMVREARQRAGEQEEVDLAGEDDETNNGVGTT